MLNDMEMDIFGKLASIQAELKAPKSQYNSFGRYNYRKCEDILEAVKPILAKYNCVILLSDDIKLVGDRYYVQATAAIHDCETGTEISTFAYAREEDEKKGMDGSQVTGASSSYARKYALNGLLCIDDTADSDTTNVGDQKPTAPATVKPASKAVQTRQAVRKTAPATPAAPASTEAYQPLPDADYAKIVIAFAKGKATKSGGSYRDEWIKITHATPEAIAKFDADVDKLMSSI